ncbi:MAG: ATP-binding protein [Solirubrobacteraceae bacterium]
MESRRREEQPTLRFAEIEARVRAAVEHVATTDPNPADPFRGLYISDELAVSLARDRAEEGLDARLGAATALLGLGELDARLLALCLAPELDPRFGRLVAYLHDDVTRRLVSPRLAARLLADGENTQADVLDRFAGERPLRRTGALRLIDGDEQTALADRAAKPADRLAAWVLGAALDGDRLAGQARTVGVALIDPGRGGALAELRSLLAAPGRLPILVAGPDAAEVLALAVGKPLLLAAAAVARAPETMNDLRLAAALMGCRACFELTGTLSPSEGAETAAALTASRERVLVCGASRADFVGLRDLETILVEVPPPSFAERLVIWSARTEGGDCEEVAAKFLLSAGQIAHAVEVAELVALAAGRTRPDGDDLHHGARQASSRRLEELATRIESSNGWDDLVLPRRQLDSLRSVSAHLRHRDLVLSGWGYDRTVGHGQGLKILFFGESGTGKTMTGRVLARELGLELYRIELAAVVSKYIGETEKNLDRIFDAATGSNAILFFDEADALFGKRSEVGDAHDRYANIEVSYLLQRMENYAGAVILATNFRSNIDDAFLRRLDFAVEFPFPEPEYRSAIWRAVLPPGAPIDRDVDIDFLAERFKLSGGSIRNCSLSAAFLAAEDGTSIGMRHLIAGVAAEYTKLGRLTLGADFEHAGLRLKSAAGPAS